MDEKEKSTALQNDDSNVQAYYDLVAGNKKDKYVIVAMATEEELAAENERRGIELSSAVAIQACYAPGGVVQGVFSTGKRLIRGKDELERIQKLI